MSTALPLVTCIMPTRNRVDFVPRAVDCFLRQDYPRKQLIVFEEEGPHASLTAAERLALADVPADAAAVSYAWSPTVRYKTIGEKRNAMCTVAQGDLIAHWDDDDWHSPHRLSTQIEMMHAHGARLCGADKLVFCNGERAWLFQTVRKPWLAGGTLVYERSLWQEQPFTEVSNGEDVAFIDAAHRRGVKIAAVSDPSLYVAMLHDRNTTTRNIDHQWGGFDVDTVRRWIGG